MKIFHLKRLLICCLIINFIIIATPLKYAYADTNMTLEEFTLDIWPEYDEPSVLGIYQGTFINKGTSDFTGYVKFNIPKDARISMACEIVNGNHLCQPYKTEDKGNYVELSWKTTRKIRPGEEYPVFLEFYYDPIQGETEKNFEYLFKPSYKMESLNIRVKQPLRTDEFSLEPQAAITKVDSKGFTDHIYSYTDVTLDKNIALKINYIKKDNKPSIEKEQPPSQPTQNSNNSSSVPQIQAWKNPMILMIIILFGLFLGGVIYYAHISSKNKEVLGNKKTSSTNPELINEKKKLRQMLINGKISEEIYKELVADLEDEYM